jgi:hypothetical protein
MTLLQNYLPHPLSGNGNGSGSGWLKSHGLNGAEAVVKSHRLSLQK